MKRDSTDEDVLIKTKRCVYKIEHAAKLKSQRSVVTYLSKRSLLTNK